MASTDKKREPLQTEINRLFMHLVSGLNMSIEEIERDLKAAKQKYGEGDTGVTP
jgi:hypothetical protein